MSGDLDRVARTSTGRCFLDDRQAPAAVQPSIHWPPSTLIVWPVM